MFRFGYELVKSPIISVLKAHSEEYDEDRDSPPNEHILSSGEHSAFFHDVGDQRVHVEGLQHHEQKASREEEVKNYRHKPAQEL